MFVSEVVRLLATEGGLDHADRPLGVPTGVREAISGRARRLTEPCREALVLASVLGREFALRALEHMGSPQREELLDALDEATSEGVIGEVSGAPGQFRFAHVLIRDVLYDELTPTRRMRLHRLAGDALEEVYAEALDPHLAELAHHFARAAPAGDSQKAIDYARRAGDRASSLLAYEEAARLYEAALTLTVGDIRRCELLLALGDARARAGDTPASKRAFRDAAELAENLELSDHLAQAALGYGGRLVWDVARDDPSVLPLLERALVAIGSEDTPARVRLLARLAGGPLRDASFPRERRAALSREALDMARRLGDSSTLAYALVCYIQANLSPDSVTEDALGLSGELVSVALAAGEEERAFEGHEDRLLTLLGLGDRHGATVELEAITRLANELRQPAQEWVVIVYRALWALLDGRLDEAEELISRAWASGERAQGWNAAVSHGLQLFVLRRTQGRLAEIEDLIRSSAGQYPTYPIWQCVLVDAAAQLGREAEARARLEGLAADTFAGLPFDEEWLVGMTLLAEAAASLGEVIHAAAIYDLLLPYADRVAVSYPEVSTGAVARYLAVLAATLGRWGEAEGHFETARQMNARIGARAWLAHTEFDFARMLRARNRDGDIQRANDLERSARGVAHEIGLSL